MSGRPPFNPGSGRLPFNKVCELEDFSDPELVSTLRDACAYKIPHLSVEYPNGFEHRKDWEVAMAVRSLREFGVLRRDARILGVGAGTEDTVFWLTRHVEQVFATDRYLEPGAWSPVAPMSMLVEPEVVATQPFDAARLVAQHMDGRALRYPDDMFDGIFSSGSIEHFGDFGDVANAAYEMGRVLRPGGVLAISTEFRMGGPPGGRGWPGLTLLLSVEELQRYIVEASGLQLVDPIRTEVSDATLATPRDLTTVVAERAVRVAEGYEEYTGWDFPHLVLASGGYVFGSVHLTLVKGDPFPATPNAWARPSAETVRAISEYNRSILASTGTAAPAGAVAAAAGAGAAASPAAAAESSWEARAEAVRADMVAVENGEVGVNARIPDLDAGLGLLDTALVEIDVLRQQVDDHLAVIAHSEVAMGDGGAAGAARDTAAGPSPVRSAIAGTRPGWVCRRIVLPEGPEFMVMLDTTVHDTVAEYLAAGVTIDQLYLGLMLQLVQPGQLVLDLGAHVGTFSLAAAAAGCHAVAVEAAPHNVELLQASVARNGYHGVRVVHAAASDQPGTVQFWPRGPWGRLATPGADEPSVTVPAVTVQDLLAELASGWPSFVKIDVEGSELRAMGGMRDLLAGPSAPPVLYESNGHTLAFYDTTPDDLLARMEDHGYTSYMVTGDRRLVRARAGEMQPQTLVDYLALKRAPSGLDGWVVEPGLSRQERIALVVADCRHVNEHHRAHMARTLASCEDGTVSHPDVARALDDLTNDPVADVREAASWFSAMTPAGATDRPDRR